MDALILRALNLPHPEQVMTLEPKDGSGFLSHPEMRDVRDGNTVFSAVASYRPSDFGVEARGVTRSVWACEVSGHYFEVFVGAQSLSKTEYFVRNLPTPMGAPRAVNGGVSVRCSGR